eukprot:704118-Hanusia_phi.AAC.1
MTTARTTFRSSAIFLLLVLGSAQLVLEDVPTEHEEAKKPESSGQAADPMTRMLQWGVDHTDHESLAERARAIREGRAQPTKIDREVMDALFGTKVKFLQKVVDKLLSSVRQGDAEELVEVLEELEGEITDIDNANDLDKLGGLDPVLELLAHEKREVKAAALWVVGTAAQSNPVLQELLAGKRVLAKLLAPMEEAAVAKSRENLDAKLVAKSLYAISTFVRGCKSCLEQFVEGGGATSVSALLSLLSHDSPEVPPVWLSPARKTVALIGDLVQEENAPVNLRPPPCSPTSLPCSSSSSTATSLPPHSSLLLRSLPAPSFPSPCPHEHAGFHLRPPHQVHGGSTVAPPQERVRGSRLAARGGRQGAPGKGP